MQKDTLKKGTDKKNFGFYFRNIIIAVATLFTLKGKISPKSAKVTGPTPSPYPKVEQITHAGIKI